MHSANGPTSKSLSDSTMSTENITLPTIHLNGNSREALLQQYTEITGPLVEALNAITEPLIEALNAIERVEFHPRDYYVQGDEAFGEAAKERAKVYLDLERIIQYFHTHVNHIEYGEHNANL